MTSLPPQDIAWTRLEREVRGLRRWRGNGGDGTAPAPSVAAACDNATGRVPLVGPGKRYAEPSEAAAVAQTGDVIKVGAGDYVGDVTTWSADGLTICGVGGRARLFANGRNGGGKGSWVVRGTNSTIDSLEFHDATVPDENGAGTRHEGYKLVKPRSATTSRAVPKHRPSRTAVSWTERRAPPATWPTSRTAAPTCAATCSRRVQTPYVSRSITDPVRTRGTMSAVRATWGASDERT